MLGTAHHRGVAVVAAAYAAGSVWFGLRPGLAAESESSYLATRALIAFLLPTKAAVLLWLFSAISSRQSAWGSDPHGCTATERILLRCVIFIGALHGLIILRLSEIPWMRPWAPRLALVLFGAVLVSVGNLLPTTRPNLLVGIRTARSLRCPFVDGAPSSRRLRGSGCWNHRHCRSRRARPPRRWASNQHRCCARTLGRDCTIPEART
jgi:hypothetical protein